MACDLFWSSQTHSPNSTTQTLAPNPIPKAYPNANLPPTLAPRVFVRRIASSARRVRCVGVSVRRPVGTSPPPAAPDPSITKNDPNPAIFVRRDAVVHMREIPPEQAVLSRGCRSLFIRLLPKRLTSHFAGLGASKIDVLPGPWKKKKEKKGCSPSRHCLCGEARV